MIITRLVGGLGNQMFQYAAGLALAHARRTVLKLDVSWFRESSEFEAHNRYALSCFNITEQFATDDESEHLKDVQRTRAERWSIHLATVLRLQRYVRQNARIGNWHRAVQFHPYPEFHRQPDHTYLDGMWQAEDFFAPVSDLLRSHFSFRYPPPKPVFELAAQISQGSSIAVHFRRGDYTRNSTFNREMGVLDLDYYYRAVNRAREHLPNATLYVFSDDIDSVEKEFRPSAPVVFVRAVQPWHAHDKIRLMSLCNDIVIANSTFSWWAAWLNPSDSKLVIAPHPWFEQSTNNGDWVVPKSWLRLPRRT